MVNSIRNHALFWTCSAAGFLAIVWVLGDVLLPFVCGMAIAYLLGPLVRRLIHRGMPRRWAALSILGTFFLILTVLLALIIPFAYREILQLASDLPQITGKIQDQIGPYIQWMQAKFHTGDLTQYQAAIKDNLDKVFKVGGTLVAGVIGGGQLLMGILSFILITPIVAYFVMEQWVVITHWIDDMIPRRNYGKIRFLLTQMDQKVSGFIRGQLIISFFLGISYAIILTCVGLKFGFLIGLMTGMLSVIPLVGSTIGFVTSLAVAWFQTHSLGYTGIIAGIFFIGQFLEGNVITPKVMGKSVGLHPVWILFALLAGAALMGLTGMFLAVPVAAVIGVLCSFAISEYKKSLYYDNVPEPESHVPPVHVTVHVPDAKAEAPLIIHPDDPQP